MSIDYEWGIRHEVFDFFAPSDKLSEFGLEAIKMLMTAKLCAPPNGDRYQIGELYLHRADDEGNQDEATVQGDGTLPRQFQTSSCKGCSNFVPQKYHKELAIWKKRGCRNG